MQSHQSRGKEAKGEYVAEGDVGCESAKDLNRSLFPALRKVGKKTGLRSGWSSDDGITQKSFDYVLKKTTKAAPT